jgi:hypothetical protein
MREVQRRLLGGSSSLSFALSSLVTRRTALVALSVLVFLYVTACCAVYVRSLSVFGGGAFFSSLRAGAGAAAAPARPALSEEEEKLHVRADLGRGAWNMLHRMGAQYDKEPTPERRREMVEFVRLLGEFYPCPECAAHFRAMLAENPVEADDNRSLSLWLCRVHNIVNERLSKPLFTCTLDALKERWGSCGCFDDKGKEGEEAAGEGAGEGAKNKSAAAASDVRTAWSGE